jgi:hypothetical protein
MKPTPDLWLIWSMEHRSYWMPDHNGYTPSRAQAGRYPFHEACEIVANGNYGAPPDHPHEAMILDATP